MSFGPGASPGAITTVTLWPPLDRLSLTGLLGNLLDQQRDHLVARTA
jgi:hypothetical protein